jgi:alkyl-hydroperoxide reductase/thiol specific antioxidant family protein
VAALPALGSRAPAAPPLGEVEGPAVVGFMRHVGCPFAEATMRSMSEQAERHPQLAWIAVSHAGLEATDHWCTDVGASRHIRLVIDEGRSAYAGWGLGATSLGHFMGRRSLRAVARLAREGIRNRHPAGTRWQRAGTFAVGERGVIVWRHLPSHAGDLPDLEQAVEALGALDSHSPAG